MFKSSFSFLLVLAILAFTVGFVAMVRQGGEPSDGDKLDAANEAIASLIAKNDEVSERVRYVSSQVKTLADQQAVSTASVEQSRAEVQELAESHGASFAEIRSHQSAMAEQIDRLFDEQKGYAEHSDEKLDRFVERFDFGDARMREIADAQEDFAALGEKIRHSAVFQMKAVVDLGEVGRVLSMRLESVGKNRASAVEDPKGKAKSTPLTNEGFSRVLKAVLARAETEYGVIFIHQESEEPGNDLTSSVSRMIRELSDDDPILSLR